MAQFLLLIRGGDDARNSFTPEQIELKTKKYFAWTDQLRTSDHLVAAEQLHPGGQVVRERGDNMIVDGLFAETKEHIGGFYPVNATDAAETADSAARSCYRRRKLPHKSYRLPAIDHRA